VSFVGWYTNIAQPVEAVTAAFANMHE